jgi:hypothetical protein
VLASRPVIAAGNRAAGMVTNSPGWRPTRILMRRIIVITVVVGLAPLFAGCFTADDSGKPLASHSQQCQQLGFKPGTPEHAKCRLELAHRANPRGVTPATED